MEVKQLIFHKWDIKYIYLNDNRLERIQMCYTFYMKSTMKLMKQNDCSLSL